MKLLDLLHKLFPKKTKQLAQSTILDEVTRDSFNDYEDIKKVSKFKGYYNHLLKQKGITSAYLIPKELFEKTDLLCDKIRICYLRLEELLKRIEKKDMPVSEIYLEIELQFSKLFMYKNELLEINKELKLRIIALQEIRDSIIFKSRKRSDRINKIIEDTLMTLYSRSQAILKGVLLNLYNNYVKTFAKSQLPNFMNEISTFEDAIVIAMEYTGITEYKLISDNVAKSIIDKCKHTRRILELYKPNSKTLSSVNENDFTSLCLLETALDSSACNLKSGIKYTDFSDINKHLVIRTILFESHLISESEVRETYQNLLKSLITSKDIDKIYEILNSPINDLLKELLIELLMAKLGCIYQNVLNRLFKNEDMEIIKEKLKFLSNKEKLKQKINLEFLFALDTEETLYDFFHIPRHKTTFKSDINRWSQDNHLLDFGDNYSLSTYLQILHYRENQRIDCDLLDGNIYDTYIRIYLSFMNFLIDKSTFIPILSEVKTGSIMGYCTLRNRIIDSNYTFRQVCNGLNEIRSTIPEQSLYYVSGPILNVSNLDTQFNQSFAGIGNTSLFQEQIENLKVLGFNNYGPNGLISNIDKLKKFIDYIKTFGYLNGLRYIVLYNDNGTVTWLDVNRLKITIASKFSSIDTDTLIEKLITMGRSTEDRLTFIRKSLDSELEDYTFLQGEIEEIIGFYKSIKEWFKIRINDNIFRELYKLKFKVMQKIYTTSMGSWWLNGVSDNLEKTVYNELLKEMINALISNQDGILSELFDKEDFERVVNTLKCYFLDANNNVKTMAEFDYSILFSFFKPNALMEFFETRKTENEYDEIKDFFGIKTENVIPYKTFSILETYYFFKYFWEYDYIYYYHLTIIDLLINHLLRNKDYYLNLIGIIHINNLTRYQRIIDFCFPNANRNTLYVPDTLRSINKNGTHRLECWETRITNKNYKNYEYFETEISTIAIHNSPNTYLLTHEQALINFLTFMISKFKKSLTTIILYNEDNTVNIDITDLMQRKDNNSAVKECFERIMSLAIVHNEEPKTLSNIKPHP